MMMVRRLRVFALALLVCGSIALPSLAQEASPPRAPAISQKTTPPQPTLADFLWLVGAWQGDLNALQADQVYMAPKNGLMLGTFRLTNKEKTLLVEIFTLLEKKDGVELYVRHFNPELVIGEAEKDRPLLLKLARLDAKQAEFRTPEGTRPPIRDLVTRTGDDTFTVHIEVSGENGQTQTIDISYHRAK
jgi:hypothetical protein